MRSKGTAVFLLVFISLFWLCGCGQRDEGGKKDGKLSVVTTIFPPFDFVRQVGGEHVDVKMLLKPGMESHSYEPSPADIISIGESDLFLYGGGESDVWVEKLISGGRDVDGHALLDWVDPLVEETTEGMQVKGHDHAHEEAVHLDEEEYDEHVWTSPKNAMLLVENICEALSEKDPAHAGEFRSNADEYLKKLEKLDQAFEDVVSHSKRKTIIFGDRFPLLYFVKTYGLSYYAAFPGCSMETEPSAAMIAWLTDKVKQEKIPVVFYLEMSNGKIAEAVAEASGAKTAVFYSGHSITAADLKAGEDYLSLMYRNVEALKEALGE